MTTEQKLNRLISRVAELEHKLVQARQLIASSGAVLKGGSRKMRLIQRTVANRYGVPETLLVTRHRDEATARTRHMAMVLCRELTTSSTQQIADHFDRDHGTVVHATQRIRDLCQTYPLFAAEFAEVRALCADALEADAKKSA